LLTSSDVPEERVRVLASRLIAPAWTTAAHPSEEVISRFMLLKNSDCLGRQILAEKQKFNYARQMNNAEAPMVLYTCFSGFQRQEATRKILPRFTRVTH
jgi:hypothetical protein